MFTGPWSTCGPWSVNQADSTKVPVIPNNFLRRIKILTISHLLYLILDISKLQSRRKVVASIK